MNCLRFIALVALTSLITSTSTTLMAQTPTYTVVDLGTFGGRYTEATSINNFGHVVGTSEKIELTPEGWNIRRAFLWLPQPAHGLPSGMYDLGTLGGSSSWGNDLNDAGQVVGYADMPYDDDQFVDDYHAFSWRSRTMTDLGTVNPSLWGGSGARAINILGQIVGWRTTGFALIPLLWLPTSAYGLPAGLNNLSAVGLEIETGVNDINSAGAIVGAIGASDFSGLLRAFIWLPSPQYGLPAGFTQLIFDEFGDSEALAINESGQIIGYQPVLLPGSKWGQTHRGFSWENGVLTTLPTLGGLYTKPTGLNDFGEVVGFSEIDETTGAICLWKNGGVINLDLELPVDSGIQLWEAKSINDAGQIVGHGRLLSNGEHHAVLLNPVCPRLLPPYPEPQGVAKNRYLSLGVAYTGPPAAIKVTLVDVQGFPSFNGQVRWVGPPTTYQDAPDGSLIFSAAPLQCTPHFADWGGLVPLHVFGSEVVPGSTYQIQIVRQACPDSPTGDPETSAPTTVYTTIWGDVVAPFGTGQPNFTDISALVAAFKNSPNAPARTRVHLRPNIPDPAVTSSFLDVSLGVDAYKGRPYPFAGPVSCGP